MPSEKPEDPYENAPFGYLSMSRDGRILTANHTMLDWTGYTLEQLSSKRIVDLLTVPTRILYETSYAPLLSMSGSFDGISVDLRTASGGTIAAVASGKVFGTTSQPDSVTRVAFLKAAERRRYERQLVDAHAESKGLLESERETSVLREQFIAVLGHDLRNPVAAISGGLRLLKKEQPAERRIMLIDMLESSVQRMSSLIENVLDFARGRLGSGIPLVMQDEIWLAPVLEHVIDELRIASPDSRIETDFDLPVPVKCDPSRLAQLVSNLLGNALTHGAPGQPVTCHADTNDQELTIWIENSGDPIPQAALDQLFHPFFRGDVRSSQQGLGLGLYIVSEIAKAHRGTLDVTSTPERTRFTFQMSLR